MRRDDRVASERDHSVIDPRWSRVEQVFNAALEAGPAHRVVVERECADDPELAHEVQSLLAAHAAPGAADRLERELTAHARDEGPSTGDRVGRYEIMERLGGGGMGEVYTARDERLGRTVALKLLHPMLSAVSVERGVSIGHIGVGSRAEIHREPSGSPFRPFVTSG